MLFETYNSEKKRLTRVGPRRTQNTVGKGENAGYQHFLLFSQWFSKSLFHRVVKVY